MINAMKIQNRITIGTTAFRKRALEIVEAGFAAIDTAAAIERGVRFEKNTLCVGNEWCSLAETKRVFVVGIGKCAADAGAALERVLGDHLTGGVVLSIRKPEAKTSGKIEYLIGTHPMPSEQNVEATKRIVSLLKGLTEHDLVMFVVSGGGSTLLCFPESGMRCIDEELILKTLFVRGATIQEINTIRKHTSLARGGNLAKYAYPAQSVALIFSDVPGDNMEFIASGPTVKDTTTVRDADAILAKYDILRTCGFTHCGLMETPKEDKYFVNVRNILFISNTTALDAMAETAQKQGFVPKIYTARLEGEARDVAETIMNELHDAPPKTALLYGGETTVTVKVKGKGGRCLELGLSALRFIKEGELLIPFASDGRDNTDFSGPICDIITIKNAAAGKLDITEHLEGNQSYRFFATTGDYLMTGDTGSNVSDLIVGLKE